MAASEVDQGDDAVVAQATGPQCGLDEGERGGDVHVEGGDELTGVEVAERRHGHRAERGRVGHDGVDSPEALERGGDQGLAVGGVGDVAGNGDGGVTEVRRCPAELGAVAGVDHDVPAVGDEAAGQGQAEAA